MENNSAFPYKEIFPIDMQEIIEDLNKFLNYPVDFTAASLFKAASVAAGSQIELTVKRGWREFPVLYLLLVSRKGTMKSYPMEFAYKPLFDADKKAEQSYELEKNEYKRLMDIQRKERVKQGLDSDPVKPVLKSRIFTDTTPEALTWGLKNNGEKGSDIFVDEATIWLSNFGRYNKGNEESMYLSFWSLGTYKVTRKTTDSYSLKPVCGVFGGVQPKILPDLLKSKQDNGFLDRFLFVQGLSLTMEYLNEHDIDQEIIDRWDYYINKILDFENKEFYNQKIRYEPEAFQVFLKWQKTIVDLDKTGEEVEESGINSKLVRYFHRFCIVIEFLQYAVGNSDVRSISVNTAMKAEILINYFQIQAKKAFDLINYTETSDFLTDKQKTIYNILTDKFTLKDAAELITKHDVSIDTLRRMLKNKQLFKKIGHGKYEKL